MAILEVRMYFEDLTPYCYGTYYGRGRNISLGGVFNVGWLEKGREYTTGTVEDEILLKLKHLLVTAENANIHHKGFHFCDYCTYEDDELPSITVGNNTIKLGSRIFWLPSPDNLFYVCPNLIYHYIVSHNYCPPKEFLESVELAEIEPKWDVYKHRQMLVEMAHERIRCEEENH